MELKEVMESRYACRSFAKERVIEKEKLDALLEAIKLAPSAVNHQSPRVYVIQSELGLKTINSLCTCIANANTVLLFTYDKEEIWHSPFIKDVHSGIEDVSILATYLMLKATELGLGTCWVNYFDNQKVKEAFRLQDNEEVVLLMPLGYPSEDSEPNPIMHKKRKELSLMVRYL